jgi:hypothetical protein
MSMVANMAKPQKNWEKTKQNNILTNISFVMF